MVHRTSSASVYMSQRKGGEGEEGEVVSMARHSTGVKTGSPDELPVALSACELSTRFGSSCLLALSMVLTQASRRSPVCISGTARYLWAWLSHQHSSTDMVCKIDSFPTFKLGIVSLLPTLFCLGHSMDRCQEAKGQNGGCTFSRVDS